jgi:hypothetical protein
VGGEALTAMRLHKGESAKHFLRVALGRRQTNLLRSDRYDT